ncbi:MAG: three-Cys-motif partner protein TcmP [Verrucomicrobiia bacterium]|jgi:three-Cys-motif partner protein
MSDEKLLFELPPPVDLKVAERKFRERNPIWTGCKAKLIERYLFYFVQITHHGTYIDAFAGPQENDKLDMWSAKLVLESSPRWLRNFFLFELNDSQMKLLNQMVGNQPPRDKKKGEPKRTIKTYHGDFNQKLTEMLMENPIGDKEASFCLLDQRTFECDWASVEAIANHKKGGTKIELFYFFPEGWIDRAVSGIKSDKDPRLQKWWGKSNWPELLKKKGAVRGLYVADRFKVDLEYKYVHPFPIYEKPDKGGKVMYYMIHASDHKEAPLLMNRAYGKALDIKETPEQLDFLRPTAKPV